MRLLILKNDGDSISFGSEGKPYSKIQQELAAEIAKHIAENPIDQHIESVNIKWKKPLNRAYEYQIAED